MESAEVWQAVQARIAAWDDRRVRVDVITLPSGARSLALERGPVGVGLTVWTSGQAEMTWKRPWARPQIHQYDVSTSEGLLTLLDDLTARLYHAG